MSLDLHDDPVTFAVNLFLSACFFFHLVGEAGITYGDW